MSNNAFLPETYEVPTAGGGNYTKLKDGENRLRILSNPVFGFEYWNKENKPVRLKEKPTGTPADMRAADSNGRPERVKEFWAMKAYNYNEKRMELFQITQAGIKNALAGLSRDEEYGHPKGYDIKIKKSGAGLTTEYSVTPAVPKPVGQDVKDAFAAMSITLEALFTGENPFGGIEAATAAAPSGQPPVPRESAQPRAQKAAPAPQPAAPVANEDDNDLPF